MEYVAKTKTGQVVSDSLAGLLCGNDDVIYLRASVYVIEGDKERDLTSAEAAEFAKARAAILCGDVE